MTKLFLAALFTFTGATAHAQVDLPDEAQEAVRVGKLLYRTEMASWYGSDVFMERFPGRLDSSGGYFSYPNGDHTTCIFFTRDEEPRSLGRFSFDSTFNVNNVMIDANPGALTTLESELFRMRRAAIEVMSNNDYFERYEDMNFNLIPLRDGDKRLIYVLSGPKKNGVIVIGNDYLLTLDKGYQVRSRVRLHKNIQIMPYEPDGTEEVTMSVHSHLPETGDFITATDICTLMLYAPFADWPQHLVISENWVSIWNCKSNELSVITRKAWDRIYKDQEKRHR